MPHRKSPSLAKNNVLNTLTGYKIIPGIDKNRSKSVMNNNEGLNMESRLIHSKKDISEMYGLNEKQFNPNKNRNGHSLGCLHYIKNNKSQSKSFFNFRTETEINPHIIFKNTLYQKKEINKSKELTRIIKFPIRKRAANQHNIWKTYNGEQKKNYAFRTWIRFLKMNNQWTSDKIKLVQKKYSINNPSKRLSVYNDKDASALLSKRPVDLLKSFCKSNILAYNENTLPEIKALRKGT